MVIRKLLLAVNKFLVWSVLLAVRLAEFLKLIDFYQPLPDVGLGRSADSPRIRERLEAIKKHLPAGKLSGLDIGCNVGFYTFELAKLGHFMMAFEPLKPAYFIAQFAKEKVQAKNTAFSDMRLTPSTVQLLPRADFTILMAVFHHWCRIYGPDNGLAMLRTVILKTESVLFFETGRTDQADSSDFEPRPELGADVEGWLPAFALENGCERVEKVYSRGRQLYAIYK